MAPAPTARLPPLQVELLTEEDPELLAHTHIKHIELRVVPKPDKCKGSAAPPMSQLLLEPAAAEIAQLQQAAAPTLVDVHLGGDRAEWSPPAPRPRIVIT